MNEFDVVDYVLKCADICVRLPAGRVKRTICDHVIDYEPQKFISEVFIDAGESRHLQKELKAANDRAKALAREVAELKVALEKARAEGYLP